MILKSMTSFVAIGFVDVHDGFHGGNLRFVAFRHFIGKPEKILRDGFCERGQDCSHGPFFPTDRQADHRDIGFVRKDRVGVKVRPIEPVTCLLPVAFPQVVLIFKVHPESYWHMVAILYPMDVVHQQVLGFFGDLIIEADAETTDDVGTGFDLQAVGTVP